MIGERSEPKQLSHYIQDIDDSNKANGKPVYYWVNRQDMTIPFDGGWIALINCTGITVENLNLTNNGQGILLAYTTHSTMTKNKMTNNSDGILLDCSSENSISENNITENNGNGIRLTDSSNNTVSRNNITANNYDGIIFTDRSNSNRVSGNDIKMNIRYGVTLFGRGYNIVHGNNITNNGNGLWIYRSSDNCVSGNNITNSGVGVYLSGSSSNKFDHNNIIDNTKQVYLEGGANVWDDGYPSGANYWSDHACTDNPSDGSQPCIIDEDNIDRYPFQDPSAWLLLAIAEAGMNQTVDEDTVVTLDGSASRSHADLVSYVWIFSDVTAQILSGATVTYNFANPGTYVITLNVTDARGNSDTDNVTITVNDITHPVADAGSDRTVTVDTTASFGAGGSSDNVGIASYEWDYGDGTTGTGETTTHTYKETGTFTVVLTVREGAGNSATDAITISVEAAFPWWIAGVAAAAIVGVAVVVYLAKVRKP